MEPDADTPHHGPLRATIVAYEGAPDECTIHPLAVDGRRSTTTWITAREGSFRSLAAMR